MEDESATDSRSFVDEEGLLAPAYRYDYAGRCWWCGQAADSGEHKYKRTDIVRGFGKGPWRGQSAVVRIVDGMEKDLQSPGSRGLKFAKVLCGDCNSARSQEFDRAYEAFSNYVMSEQEHILSNNGFRWSRVFGSQWRSGRNLVTAYWVKHIGCRLAEGGVEVNPGITGFLDHPHMPPRGVPLRLELQIREDWLAVSEHIQQSHGEDFNALWMGNLMCLYSRNRQMIRQATGDWGIGWIGLTYQFDFDYTQMIANFWRDRVRLPHVSSVDPELIDQNCKVCHLWRITSLMAERDRYQEETAEFFYSIGLEV